MADHTSYTVIGHLSEEISPFGSPRHIHDSWESYGYRKHISSQSVTLSPTSPEEKTARPRLHKATPEIPKVVLSKSRIQWIASLLFHVVPIAAAAVMLAVNLKGYFIGSQFVGVKDARSQSIALLSLQVTSKLFEIAVIASLGYIVLDIVHHFLLFDDFGLPLALSGIRSTFTNLFHLATPSFWSGIGTFRSWKARVAIAIFLVDCGLIATFVGPAAALLLIPSRRDSWPAGGLRFRLTEDAASLWPSKLNISHAGPSTCYDPLEEQIRFPDLNLSPCPWYASSHLGVSIYGTLGWHGNLTVDDHGYQRDISWSLYNIDQAIPTNWAWSSSSIANMMTSRLHMDWEMAVNYTHTVNTESLEADNHTSWGPLSKYNRYAYRERFGTQAQLAGMSAPAVRTYCTGSVRDFNDTSPLPFPVVLDNGNYRQDTNETYMIPVSLIANTSIIRSTWISSDAVSADQISRVHAARPPSAFLALQYPIDSTTSGIVLSCSLDARWVQDALQLTHTFDSQEFLARGYVGTYAVFTDSPFDYYGRPLPEKSTSVDLGLDWLEHLTPAQNESSSTGDMLAFNTMTKVLDQALRDNLEVADAEEMNVNLLRYLEYLVPVLVVDGMARSNLYAMENGTMGQFPFDWINDDSTTVDPTIMLAGAGGTDPLPTPTSPSSDMLWTVSIAGFAYAADSTAAILAIIVLSNYILLALCHSAFVMYKRRRSGVWWSIPEMVALCLISPPTPLLKNTAGGIDSSSTNRLGLRLRAQGSGQGEEKMHVLVGKGQRDPSYRKIVGYHPIEAGEKYG